MSQKERPTKLSKLRTKYLRRVAKIQKEIRNSAKMTAKDLTLRVD